jgi:molybdate transport system substrate-binding protein
MMKLLMLSPRVLGAIGPALFLACAIAGCAAANKSAARPQLRVLCGSSMATPAQEIGKTFCEQNGGDIEYDFGGSETLLPKILAGAQADIYICHDPFEEKVRAGGQLAGCTVVGYLEPVLAVRPGNPKQLRSVEDLARPDVRLGIGDPRYSTCGEMFVALLEKRGLKDKVMPQVVVQMRSHTELAYGMITGHLDAAVIWNFAAVLYKDKLEVVNTDDSYDSVRVTVVGLAKSATPALRDRYLEYCKTEGVQTAFKTCGYRRGGVR